MSTLNVKVDLSPIERLRGEGKKIKNRAQKNLDETIRQFKKMLKQEVKTEIDKI